MAQAGGAHGGDVWVPELARLIDEEPEPPDVPTAIGPLAQLGVDVGAVQAAVDRYLGLAEADWHPHDWRRSHPEFPPQYAGVAYAYTHERLGIYRVLGEAMQDAARGAGPGGVSPRMRTCAGECVYFGHVCQAAASRWRGACGVRRVDDVLWRRRNDGLGRGHACRHGRQPRASSWLDVACTHRPPVTARKRRLARA